MSSSLPSAQTSPDDHVRVFPGARGFGVRTPAGRGGRILRVTNLNSEGPGTLREALSTRGPRIVVFEVGGVIDLQMKSLTITEPFLTLAGQTAPAPGITLIRGGLQIRTHDVLIRHLRIRPGDAGRPRRSGWEPDVSTWGADANNIVIDHCSISWCVAGNFNVSGPRGEGPNTASRNVTISNSILAEALADSSNSKGSRSIGTLVTDNCTNVALIGNLYAHNDGGNPAFRANTTGLVANNVIYDPGRGAIHLDWSNADWAGHPAPHNPRVSVAGNVMYAGPSTTEGVALVSRKGDAWMTDNLAFEFSGTPASITSGLINVLAERPVWPRTFVPLPASKVLDSVLRRAGARPKERDDQDRRLVSEVHDRKGKIINSQDEVGGYPKTPMQRRRLIAPTEDLDDWLAKLAAEVEQ